MSRIFNDANLLTWEAYASGGKFGMPGSPKLVFHCLSTPDARGRYVVLEGDEADAEAMVHSVPEERLRQMLSASRELD